MIGIQENFTGFLNSPKIRFIYAAIFFIVLNRIIYHILFFFSFDMNIIQMYMAWIGTFVILITILPFKRYEIYAIKN